MYSKTFIDKLKEVYPESTHMHKLAENGDYFLGRYLDDSSQGSISVESILEATSLQQLQNVARILKIKKELYAEWHNEVRK